MTYPRVYSSLTGEWTELFQEAVNIETVGGIEVSSPSNNDVLKYNTSSAAFVNDSIENLLVGKNISTSTLTTSGIANLNSASVINNANINGNLIVGSSLTVNGVLITGASSSATVTTEQIQDAAAPLFDHAFHTNITATYDDANNRILLSASASSASVTITTEEIQDAAAPLLNHAFHNNITATYDDANNRILLSASASSGSVSMSTEDIQDAAAPLLNHNFHNNITATYDDANNRIILSGSASSGSASMSTEDIQDIVGPMFAHSNHTNASASYNDGTGQILISVASPSSGSGQTNFYDVVRDYGAVAGETNSATKIQNALNAARDAGSGIVYIPAGTYNIESTLQIFSGTTLYLTPKTVIFRQFATNPLIANGANGASYSGYSGQSNIRIIGGIWESRGQAYPIQPAMAISIGHGTDILIKDLTISNTGGYHAIEINSSKNVRVENCRLVGFVNTGNRGYSEAVQIDLAREGLFGWFGSYDLTHCTDITIRDCYFSSSGTAGTTAWPTGIGTHSFEAGQYHKNIKLINNTFEGLTQYAIRTYNNYDGLLIQGNIVKDCFGGIAVGPDNDADFTATTGSTMLGYSDNQTSLNVTISDNSIDNSGTTGTNGIWVINAQNVNILNNRIKGLSRSGSSLADGILCVKLVNAIISNNNLQDIGDDGIDVRTDSANVFISNNLTTDVSQTTNNTYRHIYLNDNADNCSIISNRGYRSGGNIAAQGLNFTSTSNNLRYFGNYYGSSATTAVSDSSVGSSTSTANA